MGTYDNIWKNRTGQGDDYTTGCLLNYTFLKKHYKLIAIDLCKLQALDADLKAMEPVNSTGNLTQERNTRLFSFTEEAKWTILDFS